MSSQEGSLSVGSFRNYQIYSGVFLSKNGRLSTISNINCARFHQSHPNSAIPLQPTQGGLIVFSGLTSCPFSTTTPIFTKNAYPSNVTNTPFLDKLPYTNPASCNCPTAITTCDNKFTNFVFLMQVKVSSRYPLQGSQTRQMLDGEKKALSRQGVYDVVRVQRKRRQFSIDWRRADCMPMNFFEYTFIVHCFLVVLWHAKKMLQQVLVRITCVSQQSLSFLYGVSCMMALFCYHFPRNSLKFSFSPVAYLSCTFFSFASYSVIFTFEFIFLCFSNKKSSIVQFTYSIWHQGELCLIVSMNFARPSEQSIIKLRLSVTRKNSPDSIPTQAFEMELIGIRALSFLRDTTYIA